MKYIEAPKEYEGGKRSVFLAGSITGAMNWQRTMVSLLRTEGVVVLNPRREHFPMDDPSAARTQIEWEFRHMNRASAISFWFSKETLAPITLLELGTWLSSKRQKPLFVGVDPEYKRKEDVIIQTGLRRKDVQVVFSLEELAKQIKNWINGRTVPEKGE